MKPHPLTYWILVLVSALGFHSCSSSGGGTGGTGIVSRGAISEFGSIVVNGTEFDTSDAEVIVNGDCVGSGDAAVAAWLDIGRVVTVIGTGSEEDEDARAEQVIYRNDVKGPVTDVAETGTEALEITVLGQTVRVNTATRLVGTSMDALATGDRIEVSGYDDDTGKIWATYLEKLAADTTGEVVGKVLNPDSVRQTFHINALTVDYATADTSLLPGGEPAEGLLVEVNGIWNPADQALTATRIGLADALEVDDAGQIEIMGFVTGFTTMYAFVVGNQPVQVSTNAEIVDGTISDIGLGVKLEVEGTLKAGILQAHEIEFWAPDQIELEDVVTDIFSSSSFFVGDQEVAAGPNTVYEDGLPGDIEPGIILEIKGCLIQGVLHADKVSFEME